MRKRIGTAIVLVLVAALAIAGAIAWVNRGEIRDYFAARSFEPSQRIAEVQTEIALTPRGDRVFLASGPTIGGREEFSKWCEKVEHSEQGHVLGCFSDRRIRLFDVTDERLDGVVETTAAHELLHAAWSRLPADERERLTKLLRKTYDERAEVDAEFKERMSVYADLSEAAFANELHSVLGTEVAELPKELEDHYAEWLTDRAKIVRWYEDYHSVFTQLSAEADALQAELERLRADIEARSADYDAAVTQFNADAADFKARNERYEFSGKPELFNSTRAALVARQEALNLTLQAIQADTDHFNSQREKLLQLNDVSAELNDSLDSTPPPPTGPTATPDSSSS